jgi:hypothetical protein
MHEIFRGDVVRIKASLPEGRIRFHSELIGYQGINVTVANIYHPGWDNNSVAFEFEDIEEIVSRVPRPLTLRPYDEVTFTADMSRLGAWNTRMRKSYAGKKMMVSQILGSGNFQCRGTGDQFKVDEVDIFHPRADGTTPQLPYIPKVGDEVLLEGTPGGPLPSGWPSYWRHLQGAVVTITALGTGIFAISDHSGSAPTGSIVRLATEEDKANWEIAKAKEKVRLEKLMSTLFVDPEKIADLARGIFGEDRVTVSGERGDFFLVIHFPEIDLTNSLGQKNKILDLFVQIRCNKIGQDPGFVCFIELQGARTTWSRAELNSGYNHSHLPSGGVLFPTEGQVWNRFCLGSSEIRMIVDNVRLSGQEENWMLLLLSLKNYVSWESIEGGPHMSIRSITKAGTGSTTVANSVLVNELLIMMKKIPLELWEYSPSGFVLNANNPDVQEFFNKNSTIRSLTVTGTTDQVDRRIRENKSKKYTFNKKTFSFKVADEPDKEDSSKTIDQAIVVWYCNYLIDQVKNFSKTYTYDICKSECKEAFASVRI